MRRIVFFFLPLFVFALLIATANIGAVTKGISVVFPEGRSVYLYKDYHALVVGVSKYDKWPEVPNAVRDAREISRFLKQLGFKVTLVTDPTSQELKRALDDLAQNTGQEAERGIVFYYAGHGETQTLAYGANLGFIIPRDCPLLRDDPYGFSERAISTRDIETLSMQIRARHVLMFFDSSFSGAVFSLEPAVLEAISEKSVLPVRQYIISGKEDETVPDRSRFKQALLKGLKGYADLIYDGYVPLLNCSLSGFLLLPSKRISLRFA